MYMSQLILRLREINFKVPPWRLRFDLFVNKWIFDFLKKKFFESCTRSHSAWRNRWVSFRSQINTCGSTFRKSYPGETRYPSPVMKKSIVSFLKSWAQINSRMDSDQIDFSRVCYTSLRVYSISCQRSFISDSGDLTFVNTCFLLLLWNFSHNQKSCSKDLILSFYCFRSIIYI